MAALSTILASRADPATRLAGDGEAYERLVPRRAGPFTRIIGRVVQHQQVPSGGRTAEWCVSWQAGPRHVAEVIGSKGSLRIENARGDNLGTATTLEIFDLRRNRTVETFEATDQFWLQLQHMQDVLDNGVPHRIPPANSVAQMRVIDAVYASLASGRPEPVGKAAR